MLRRSFGIIFALAIALAVAAAAEQTASQAKLSAVQIVDKNVEARGGLQAWRAVHTISLQGKLGAGGNQRGIFPMPMPDPKAMAQIARRRPAEETQLPFVMELKRVRKMRFELQFNGQTALQVYDGTNGWKLRPFLNRREVEPYSTEEMQIASMQPDLDGPLVDYAAKGTSVELEGMEKVADRNTYRLKLTMKDGHALHVWIDAQTFLEVKVEGQPRRLDGTDHPVEVYYRDYRPVSGLQIPFVLETKVLPVARTVLGRDVPVPPEKIIVDKVVVNPKLDEKRFSKPEIVVAQNAK